MKTKTTPIQRKVKTKEKTCPVIVTLTSTGGGIAALLLPLSREIVGTDISLGDNAGASSML